MTLRYFTFINSYVQIDFDEEGDPNYCEIYDPRQKQFVRRNEILDDVLNHPETVEVEKTEFARILSGEQGLKHSVS